MQLKSPKKRFVQCMEKVLWLTEHVKSGLRSFVLEISWWTMLRGQEDHLKLTVIETLIEDSQHSSMWETADILKISKSITLLVKTKTFILQKKSYGLFGQPSILLRFYREARAIGRGVPRRHLFFFSSLLLLGQPLLLVWKLVSGLQIQVDLVASSNYVNSLSYERTWS